MCAMAAEQKVNASLGEVPDFIAAQIPDPVNASPNQISPGAVYGYWFNWGLSRSQKIWGEVSK